MNPGETIKCARKKAFYTQEAFASKLGVAVSTVNRWEMGKAEPNMRDIKAIKDFCMDNSIVAVIIF